MEMMTSFPNNPGSGPVSLNRERQSKNKCVQFFIAKNENESESKKLTQKKQSSSSSTNFLFRIFIAMQFSYDKKVR
jgi:hypothetical protein